MYVGMKVRCISNPTTGITTRSSIPTEPDPDSSPVSPNPEPNALHVTTNTNSIAQSMLQPSAPVRDIIVPVIS